MILCTIEWMRLDEGRRVHLYWESPLFLSLSLWSLWLSLWHWDSSWLVTEKFMMDMSSESSTARWYEPPRSLDPPSAGAGPAGVNPDYRSYYPHAGPTTHHPAAAAHYAHSESFNARRPPLFFFLIRFFFHRPDLCLPPSQTTFHPRCTYQNNFSFFSLSSFFSFEKLVFRAKITWFNFLVTFLGQWPLVGFLLSVFTFF